jgi:hypothetical protein
MRAVECDNSKVHAFVPLSRVNRGFVDTIFKIQELFQCLSCTPNEESFVFIWFIQSISH